MYSLIEKKILLGITGGIAAYKAAELVRRLREQGAQVQVVMTQAATHFITPLTLQALSGNTVRTSLWDAAAEAAMGHIELARWAEQIIIAPASANFIAQLAHGSAHDLLSTLCLATTAPLLIAPAMNQHMWLNAATRANIELLRAREMHIIGPASGPQACGEFGPGRMVEPGEIIEALQEKTVAPILSRRRVIITAGPTREPLDPVRYLSNRSSGKMGFALATAARAAGAEVVLISGPVSLATPANVQRIDVQSAAQMQTAVLEQIALGCDIFIAAAAVADYRSAQVALQKIKKNAATITLALERTPDILHAVKQLAKPPFTVGFAAETEDVTEHAVTKLQQKNLNLIVANQVSESSGFEVDDNAVTLIWSTGQQAFARAPKLKIAEQLITQIAKHFIAWQA